MDQKSKTLAMVKQLIMANHLSPVDVIIAKKRNGIGRILNHYIIYLGNGIFIGNIKRGVNFICQNQLLELLNDYEPIAIRRFEGNELQKQQAIFRAKQKLGHRYSFLGFNCEHYANWVQYGKESSYQVQNGFLIAAGLLTIKWMSDGER